MLELRLEARLVLVHSRGWRRWRVCRWRVAYRGPGILMPESELRAGSTLVRAGPVSQTGDPEMTAQMTRAHWRELRDWAYSSSEIDALTFKVLHELLLSPRVGIGEQHLGPLNDVVNSRVRHEVYSSGGRYSVFDSYPRSLSENAPASVLAIPGCSREERDAAASFGDNLIYTFYRDPVHRDLHRGIWPKEEEKYWHAESVGKDGLFRRMEAMQREIDDAADRAARAAAEAGAQQ